MREGGQERREVAEAPLLCHAEAVHCNHPQREQRADADRLDLLGRVHESASFCSFLVWAGVSAIMVFQWRR